MRVAILGASDKERRYSYQAFKMLQDYGHTPLPVHPKLSAIEGVPVAPDLTSLDGPVDTVTVYVGPDRSAGLAPALIGVHPRRVIFNPGAENEALAEQLRAAGIEVVEACTLVMLRTGQF